MWKRFLGLCLLFLLVSVKTYGAACCAGSGPRSFISMQELQQYEFGISTAYRDSFGSFGDEGTFLDSLDNADRQILSVSVGGGYRLHTDLEVFAIVPMIRQTEGLGSFALTSTGFGDVVGGARYTLFRNLFPDEWWPTMVIAFSVKAPTGQTKPLLLGNGIWEPSLGVELKKAFGDFIFNVSGSYTRRLGKDTLDFLGSPVYLEEGDRVETTASVAFNVSQRHSLALGATHQWDFDSKVDRVVSVDSAARSLGAFASTTYFLTRFWSITAGFEYSPPFDGWSRNQRATRAISVTTNYSIY